jgi:hypothetical protein
MEAISCCKSDKAFSMRDFWLASTSFTEVNAIPLGAAGSSVFISSLSETRLPAAGPYG